MDISVDMCLGGRQLTEPRISPDGVHVAFVTRHGGVAAVVTMPARGGVERILTTAPEPVAGRGMGGGCFAWAPNSDAVIYAAGDGDIWHQPITGGPPTRLSRVADGRRCEAPVMSHDGVHVACTVDQAAVWQWNVSTGRGERLDDGSADFVIDPSPMPPGFERGWIWHAWNVPDMAWDASRAQFVIDENGSWSHGEYVPAASIQQLRHHPDGRGTCVRDDTGWLNVWLGDEPIVDEPIEHAGPTWGPGQRSYAASPDGTKFAFTRNEGGFGRLCVVDIEDRSITQVGRGVHGQLSWAGDRLVALRSGARTPTQIVSYDATSWVRTVLAVGPVAGWEAADLPEPEPVAVDHAGTVLHARRYRAGAGRTICWVHGGPTDQWQVEFRPRIAYWWSRGWDVLVVDPRGSTGHGRAYQQALRGEWGHRDVDDTAALLAASHAGGDSTPAQTVLMGASSGGLTVLGLLARHRHLAAGGVTLYPVSDLRALIAANHRFEAHYPLSLVGPLDDAAKYTERSPVNFAHDIRGPLLVMHGDADPVVPIASTRELVDRISAAGGDVRLVEYENEGHGFRDPDHQRDEYAQTAEFLSSVVAGS